jgi:hypothetical protein
MELKRLESHQNHHLLLHFQFYFDLNVREGQEAMEERRLAQQKARQKDLHWDRWALEAVAGMVEMWIELEHFGWEIERFQEEWRDLRGWVR